VEHVRTRRITSHDYADSQSERGQTDLTHNMNVPSLSTKTWLVTVALQSNTNKSDFSKQKRNVYTIICLLLYASLTTAINNPFYIHFDIFNQSEERKPISSLVNFGLIGQNSIQSQSQSLVWYGLWECSVPLPSAVHFICRWLNFNPIPIFSLIRLRRKARIRLEIEIELEFNQSEERKPVSGLMNFALIDQNPIQSQS